MPSQSIRWQPFISFFLLFAKSKSLNRKRRLYRFRRLTTETLEPRFAFDVSLAVDSYRPLPIFIDSAIFQAREVLTSGVATFEDRFHATVALNGTLDFNSPDSAQPSNFSVFSSNGLETVTYTNSTNYYYYNFSLGGSVNGKVDNGDFSILAGSTVYLQYDGGNPNSLVLSNVGGGTFDTSTFDLRRAAVRKLPKLLFEEIGDGVKMHAI